MSQEGDASLKDKTFDSILNDIHHLSQAVTQDYTRHHSTSIPHQSLQPQDILLHTSHTGIEALFAAQNQGVKSSTSLSSSAPPDSSLHHHQLAQHAHPIMVNSLPFSIDARILDHSSIEYKSIYQHFKMKSLLQLSISNDDIHTSSSKKVNVVPQSRPIFDILSIYQLSIPPLEVRYQQFHATYMSKVGFPQSPSEELLLYYPLTSTEELANILTHGLRREQPLYWMGKMPRFGDGIQLFVNPLDAALLSAHYQDFNRIDINGAISQAMKRENTQYLLVSDKRSSHTQQLPSTTTTTTTTSSSKSTPTTIDVNKTLDPIPLGMVAEYKRYTSNQQTYQHTTGERATRRTYGMLLVKYCYSTMATGIPGSTGVPNPLIPYALYDSAVDNHTNPLRHISIHDSQTLPMYLIYFTK